MLPVSHDPPEGCVDISARTLRERTLWGHRWSSLRSTIVVSGVPKGAQERYVCERTRRPSVEPPAGYDPLGVYAKMGAETLCKRTRWGYR